MSTVTTTVLFTDLVGSTVMLDKLGQAASDDIRRRYFSLLRAAILDHGGTEVKNLGDGLMVVFAGTNEAVRCAVAMQQAIARHNRRTDTLELGLRVGIATGDATVEDGDYFGVPVVQAARLCATAAGGQVLSTAVVEMLAGSAGHSFAPVGALVLRGLADPVAACEVTWDRPLGSAVALPPALSRPEGVTFVGREIERHALELRYQAVATAGRHIAFIAGEPGVGKTRLASEIARWAYTTGAIVLYGRCYEDLSTPYQPFVEAMGAYIATCPIAELREQLGSLGGELTRLLPTLPEMVPGLDPPLSAQPETERYRLLEAIVEFLAAVSVAAPVVMVLDDVHWAANPALSVVHHIARSAIPMRLLLLATFRDSEQTQNPVLLATLADLHREQDVERITLKGLDEREVVDFIEEAAGHPLASDGLALARTVAAETGGNPFFVGQVLRNLIETGAVVLEGDQWRTAFSVDTMPIPPGVREVVSRRVHRLGDRTREVLSVAAVVGPEFDLDVLQAVCEIDEAQLLDAVEESEKARLIAPKSPNRYQFGHALVRSTLYTDLVDARRVRLHRRIAHTLETRVARATDGRLVELAHHFYMAAPLGDSDRAVIYCRQAGDDAKNGLAFDEAASLYDRALKALELGGGDAANAADRCDLLIARGEALHRAGDPSWRSALLEAIDTARTLDDGQRFADAVLAFSHWIHPSAVGGIDAELVALLEEALTRLKSDDEYRRARVLSLLAVELTFSPDADRRDDLSREAWDLARGLGDRSLLPRVLMCVLWASINNPFDYETPERLVNQLRELGETLGDVEACYYARLMSYATFIGRGDIDHADAALAHAVELAERLRQPAYVWNARLIQAAQSLTAGRLDEAEELIASTVEVGQIARLPETLAMACFGGQLFWLRHDQGRLDELEALIAAAVDAQPGMPSWRSALTLILCSSGRLDEARTHFDAAATNDFTDTPRDFVWLSGKLILADVATALDDRTRAALLAQQLLPFAGRCGWNNVACTGPVDLRLGTLSMIAGRLDAAASYLAKSASLSRRMRTPVWHARTRVAESRLAASIGNRDDAQQHAREALAIAGPIGAAAVASAARSALE